MEALTNSVYCTVGFKNDSEVYMVWNDMNWNIIGSVEIYNESKKELCKISDGMTTFFLTGTVLHYMDSM